MTRGLWPTFKGRGTSSPSNSLGMVLTTSPTRCAKVKLSWPNLTKHIQHILCQEMFQQIDVNLLYLNGLPLYRTERFFFAFAAFEIAIRGSTASVSSVFPPAWLVGWAPRRDMTSDSPNLDLAQNKNMADICLFATSKSISPTRNGAWYILIPHGIQQFFTTNDTQLSNCWCWSPFLRCSKSHAAWEKRYGQWFGQNIGNSPKSIFWWFQNLENMW